MTWRIAESLEVLRAEINAAAPNRSIVADGSIGDAAHASRDSDHNPWVVDANGIGVVRARDITHDAAAGADMAVVANAIAALLGKHPALGQGAYVIWRGRIISTDRLSEGWRPYNGSNPHDHHAHVSVGTSNYDSTAPWGALEQEDDMADYAGQLNRIEKLAEKAATQAERARKGSYERDKKIRETLDQLVETTGKTARKTQVAAIKALLNDHAEEAS